MLLVCRRTMSSLAQDGNGEVDISKSMTTIGNGSLICTVRY